MFSKIKSFLTDVSSSRKICASAMAVLSLASISFASIPVNAAPAASSESEHMLYSLSTRPVNIMPLNDTVITDSTNIDLTVNNRKVNLSVDSNIPVHVTKGNETVTVFVSRGQTVQEAIDLSGFSLDENDSVNLSLLSSIVDTDYIDIIHIEYVTSTYEQPVPYGSKTVYSKDTADTTVTTEGVDGIREITFVTKIVNGIEKEKDIIKEKVVLNPVDEIVTVGIKNGTTSDVVECISTLKPASPIQLDADGIPVEYKKHVTVQATAYTYTGHNCASGVKPQPGYVAVNTNIFPFGTKFYIKSSDGRYIYGYAVAADTGGFLKTRPSNFDLFFASEAECKAFGRRNIEVYVLD